MTPGRFSLLLFLFGKRDWSLRTFGPGTRHRGIIAHIRKELRELEDNPHDLEEWVDVMLLAMDGAWRSGASPEKIIGCLEKKMQKNIERNWPDWGGFGDDEPIEHVR